MNEVQTKAAGANRTMVQATIRIRSDQRLRLERERRARGGTLADVLRDNLDLAFAVKAELAKIIEGEYDENDPKNAPRLVHTLLFRVEERILGALDNLSLKLERRLSPVDTVPSSGSSAGHYFGEGLRGGDSDFIEEMVNGFINLIAPNSEQPPEIWIGAFLEIVPRLDLVGDEQINELKHRGELWLEEHGYYPTDDGSSASVIDGINSVG